MISLTSQKLTKWLIIKKVIPADDMDLYTYGFNQGLSLLLNMFTILLIGYLFGTVVTSVVFLVTYIPIRSYAGGYHAITPLRCYVFSVFILVVSLSIVKNVQWNISTVAIITIISSAIILVLSPIQHKHRPLNKNEIINYKKKSHYLLFVYISSILIFWFLTMPVISLSILMTLFIMATMLILGKVRSH